MADGYLAVATRAGEARIATVNEVDPEFGTLQKPELADGTGVDSMLVISTRAGEARLATEVVNDPVFGLVHKLKVVGAGAGGLPGPAGPTGPAGRDSPFILFEEPEEADEPLMLRGAAGPSGSQGAQGPQGIQGNPGPQGLAGLTILPEPPDEPAEPTLIPGPQGPAGPQGIQGPQGPAGSSGGGGDSPLSLPFLELPEEHTDLPYVGFPIPPDWDYLGGLRLAGAAVTTGVLSIRPRDELLVIVSVAGYSGGDIASLRFNGDAGANYWSRYISAAAGATTLVNNQNVSQTLARLFALTTTLQRSALVKISNPATRSKTGVVLGQTSTGAAATAGGIEFGGFEWVNTTARINSVELRTAGGSITLNAGSGFQVYGRDYGG